jgi:superfamily I DNA/RNA helicase
MVVLTMSDVITFLGGPGTGKTAHLLASLQNERDTNGIRPTDIMFVSFTRSQRDNVRVRIKDLFPQATSQDIDNAVKTFHGAALYSCKQAGVVDPNQQIIITESTYPEIYRDFCKENSIHYDVRYRDIVAGDDDRIYRKKGSIPAGNAIFIISRYLTQQNWGPERWPEAAAQIGISPPRIIGEITDLIQRWDLFKQDYGLLEHDDYVQRALVAKVRPPSKILIIDEFQDLSPTQVALFDRWRNHPLLKRIYIAGDPNQAIYGFRGANPSYLQAIAPSDLDLPISHRCPSNIVEFADNILGAGSCMVPCDDGGGVKRIIPRDASEFANWINCIHKDYQEVLVLTRYQIHALKLSKILTNAGIPHRSITPGRITYWNEYQSASEIRVDTIHASKGLQTIATVLYTGYLKGRVNDYFRSKDTQNEERRVFYVGATRSTDELYLLDDFNKNVPQAPVFRDIINTIPVIPLSCRKQPCLFGEV